MMTMIMIMIMIMMVINTRGVSTTRENMVRRG